MIEIDTRIGLLGSQWQQGAAANHQINGYLFNDIDGRIRRVATAAHGAGAPHCGNRGRWFASIDQGSMKVSLFVLSDLKRTIAYFSNKKA